MSTDLRFNLSDLLGTRGDKTCVLLCFSYVTNPWLVSSVLFIVHFAAPHVFFIALYNILKSDSLDDLSGCIGWHFRIMQRIN